MAIPPPPADSSDSEDNYEEKEQDKGQNEKVPFEDLPRKVQQRIEKRKRKRAELKLQRKLKIDFDQPVERIVEKYMDVFP